ncbi:uncharacterized protein [Linepithema humile]|uniref:uncharacterized protein isoform X1 n=1 Tax=Linepithema humile TaxID=83485 RepID=UPI0006237771|nr:PREDICTED: uncharacterized protein LOC105668717 isoform X1 [Linepithema humile]
MKKQDYWRGRGELAGDHEATSQQHGDRFVNNSAVAHRADDVPCFLISAALYYVTGSLMHSMVIAEGAVVAFMVWKNETHRWRGRFRKEVDRRKGTENFGCRAFLDITAVSR